LAAGTNEPQSPEKSGGELENRGKFFVYPAVVEGEKGAGGAEGCRCKQG